ncbi:MAG TPA: G5 domain-containing protein [Candidatus Saccharimonadales bacterium]|nr:G5 domain-containing protein [Candidatus Saccharimonadales bacterium]
MHDKSPSHKIWYKNWWGIVLVVLIWPIFVGWLVWRKKAWPTGAKIGVTALLALGAFFTSALYAGMVDGAVHPQHDQPSTATVATTAKKTQTPPKITTAQVTETQDVPFDTTTQDDSSLPKGQTKTIQAGKDGTNTLTYEVTYSDGVETNRKLLSTTATAQPVNEIDAIGTYVAPLLDTSGNGIQTTQKFTTTGDWTLNYTYDCSSFGFKGNFQVYIYNGDGSIGDVAANELGMSGSNIQYEHGAGTYYLEINSECSWHVTVKG